MTKGCTIDGIFAPNDLVSKQLAGIEDAYNKNIKLVELEFVMKSFLTFIVAPIILLIFGERNGVEPLIF